MVKIRLRRIGTKGRPFYRVVVAKSSAGRNGAFVETLGTYDPVVKPTLIKIDEERALHWLMNGAQPSETTAYLLNKVGVLPRYFEARPNAKKQYKFLDKRTAAISVGGDHAKAVEDAPAAVAAPAHVAHAAPEPVAAVAEPVAKPAPEVATEPAAVEPDPPTTTPPAEDTPHDAPPAEPVAEAAAPEVEAAPAEEAK